VVRFPFTDLHTTKLRPAIVISAFGEDVIVVGVFSRVLPGPLRDTWLLIPERASYFAQTGLKKSSLVKAEKIAIIHRSVLYRKIGSVPAEIMAQIGEKLKKALLLE
jgi:mRNA interferase MazF